MSDRKTAMTQLLQDAGWGDAQIAFLAGDASNRKYLRATQDDGSTAVVMDADPALGEDTAPFMAITDHLVACGLAPPRILARDPKHGFLLIEDLGDDLFARVVKRQPELETQIYTAAADVLLELHKHPAPNGIAPYAPLVPDLAAMSVTWYAERSETEPMRAAVAAALADAPDLGSVLILRDYHAENLLWRPQMIAPRNVGLLDYQDAMLGCPTYDLASLLMDGRRDVSAQTRDAVRAHVLRETGWDADSFDHAFAVQSAQRNLRVLCVFARLSLKYGKAHYVDFIPQTWENLQIDLAHPALAGVKRAAEVLPEPTPELLQSFKDRCGSCSSH